MKEYNNIQEAVQWGIVEGKMNRGVMGVRVEGKVKRGIVEVAV